MAAHQIGGGEIVVAGHRVEGQAQAGGHVGDEAGLAAAGRPLDEERQALPVGVLEEGDLVVGGFVEGQGMVGHCLRRREAALKSPLACMAGEEPALSLSKGAGERETGMVAAVTVSVGWMHARYLRLSQ